MTVPPRDSHTFHSFSKNLYILNPRSAALHEGCPPPYGYLFTSHLGIEAAQTNGKGLQEGPPHHKQRRGGSEAMRRCPGKATHKPREHQSAISGKAFGNGLQKTRTEVYPHIERRTVIRKAGCNQQARRQREERGKTKERQREATSGPGPGLEVPH